MKVYGVWVKNTLEYEEYEEMLFGVYSTKENAEKAMEKYCKSDDYWIPLGISTMVVDDVVEDE